MKSQALLLLLLPVAVWTTMLGSAMALLELAALRDLVTPLLLGVLLFGWLLWSMLAQGVFTARSPRR